MTENGKRLRKNWTTSHVILTELFLLFFKDSKSFVAMVKYLFIFHLYIDYYYTYYILRHTFLFYRKMVMDDQNFV